MSNLRERLAQIKAATEGRWINHGAREGGFEPAPRKAILDGFYELLTLATEAIKETERLREALANYGTHDADCVAGQSRAGRPTEDGDYETLYGYGPNERWCRRGESPPCTCGFQAALEGDQT